MPDPPRGERELRALSERFREAEQRIRALVARAPEGDRQALLVAVIAILIALRRLDLGGPAITAYLAAFRAVRRGGRAEAADDLSRSLASKLDRGAQTVQGNAREAFRTVTAENVEEVADEAVTAYVDERGTRWTISSWAQMNTETLGRRASTRGLADAVGPGEKVKVKVGACGWCQTFAGDAVVGQDPLPPFHPSCRCVASAG
jgi:hypothetical protein